MTYLLVTVEYSGLLQSCVSVYQCSKGHKSFFQCRWVWCIYVKEWYFLLMNCSFH
jgi:hypothetical protein